MPLALVSYSALEADVKHTDDPGSAKAFSWLADEIGFYPHFLSYGNEEAEALTGYTNQWARIMSGSMVNGEWKNVLRKKGENWNTVLFQFELEALADPVFTDYDWWCRCKDAVENGGQPWRREYKRCFRRTWSKRDWLRRAHKKPCDVQVLVSVIDLRKACEVWVRNKATQKKLVDMGFSNVIVKRLPILESRWKKTEAKEKAAKAAQSALAQAKTA
jgi:hypothetical protein